MCLLFPSGGDRHLLSSNTSGSSITSIGYSSSLPSPGDLQPMRSLRFSVKFGPGTFFLNEVTSLSSYFMVNFSQSWQTLLSLLVYPHCPRYYLPSIVFQQVVRGCESFEASQGYFISLTNRVATKVSTIPWFITASSRTAIHSLRTIPCYL